MRTIPASELIINDDGSIFHLHLLPEQLADTVILVGDPGRVALVAEFFDARECEVSNREFKTVTGTYKGKRMTVLSTGIGIGNIDISVTELDALANVDFATRQEKAQKRQLTLVRLGTSGAIQPDIKVGEFVFSRTSVGFDGLLNYYKGRNDVCDLAIENTMIYHTPEVVEQLESVGVPVLIERSSYESDPLGRMEWIKLYGVLTGKEEQAEALYDEQLDALAPILDRPSTGKTAAFFYITANGAANVRKSTDYVAKMLELAGGKYIFDDLTDDDARSTMNMQMESFYAGAKDADVLIYNSTIDGELQTLDELLAKSPLLADFKAVKNGNVWCTEQSLFQSAMGLGGMIQDFHAVFTGENTDDLHYLHQLT